VKQKLLSEDSDDCIKLEQRSEGHEKTSIGKKLCIDEKIQLIEDIVSPQKLSLINIVWGI